MAEFQAEHSISQQLPYWDFCDDAIVLADGTLVKGYELRGLSIECLDSDRINQITTDLRSVLNSLPDGCEVNFVHSVDSSFEEIISKHLALKGSTPNVAWVSEVRSAALKARVSESLLLRPKLSLFIYKRYEAGKESGGNFLKKFFSQPTLFPGVTRKEYEDALKELQQNAEALRATLQTVGITSRELKSSEIWEMAYRFLNPNRSESQAVPKISEEHRTQEFLPEEVQKEEGLVLPSPREQLAFSDIVQGYDAFFCDGYYHRLITLKSLPEFTHSALVWRMMQLPFHYSFNLHIRVPEQSKELSSLQAKRRMAHSMSISQGGRATDLESEARLQSAEDLLREIINTGQKILYMQGSILLRAKTRDELDSRTRTTLARIRELNGCEGLTETVAGFKVWKSVFPAGNTTLVRPKRIKTDNLADFLPVFQPFDGSKTGVSNPICLFQNRYSGLVQYDPFDAALPNYNSLVTGSSGAGKSFLNNLVLLQYVTQDPMIFVIDIGGSYRKLCEFLNGQYIEIAPPRDGESCKTVNPFELPQGQTEPSPHKIKFLLSLLENILTDEDGDKLPKLDKSLLEEAILTTYARLEKEGRCPTLSDLSETFTKSEEKSLKGFARMLFPWTGARPYGRLLDGQHQLDLSRNIVVFDLKNLAAYPDLQAAMILIITDFILGRVENTPGKRKQILMDECWELLKSRGSQRFMEYCVRTLRKTGSGITFITQGLEEIVASPIGSAILSNTATKFILLQRGDLKPIREILKLNEQEMGLIASLRQAKGRYSEAFLVHNEARTVIQAHPTPVEYWLATSDAADNQVLEERRRENPGKSLAEHIYELSQLYPYGIAGGKRENH